jgi:hypothetical protein
VPVEVPVDELRRSLRVNAVNWLGVPRNVTDHAELVEIMVLEDDANVAATMLLYQALPVGGGVQLVRSAASSLRLTEEELPNWNEFDMN